MIKQRAQWTFERACCLSVLFIGAAGVTGCSARRTPPATAPTVALAPAPPKFHDGYADLRQLVRLHPATMELRMLDTQIQRLQARATPMPTSGLAAPEAPELAPLEPLPPAPEPSRWPDRQRALDELRDEAAIRALAQPDPAADWYEAEVARLRRETRALREAAPPPAAPPDFEASRRRAEEHRQLSDQLEILREQPNDAFFYSPAQLRRRRELFRLVEGELERLRQEHLREMEVALAPSQSTPPDHPTRQVSPEKLEQARNERDRRRADAIRQLRDLEHEQVARVLDTTLPSVATGTVPDAAATTLTPAEPVRETVVSEIETANARPLSSLPIRGNIGGAVLAIRQQQRRLQELILEDVKTATLAVGRQNSVRVTFERGAAPDRTRDLLAGVREVLSRRGRE